MRPCIALTALFALTFFATPAPAQEIADLVRRLEMVNAQRDREVAELWAAVTDLRTAVVELKSAVVSLKGPTPIPAATDRSTKVVASTAPPSMPPRSAGCRCPSGDCPCPLVGGCDCSANGVYSRRIVTAASLPAPSVAAPVQYAQPVYYQPSYQPMFAPMMFGGGFSGGFGGGCSGGGCR